MKNNTKNIRKGITAILFAVIILFGALPGVSAICGICIDIKPGSCPNSININSNGVIPVAILTTPCFDAAGVDPETVVFSGASPVHYALEDVDGDGDTDLILHFRTQDTKLIASGCITLTYEE